MSQSRQAFGGSDAPSLRVRSYSVTHPADLGLPSRSYDDWDQLAYALAGVMTVVVGGARWVVPAHRALWIPAGVAHSVELAGRVRLRTVYLRRGQAPWTEAGCRSLNVTPLVRELIQHLCVLNTVHAGDLAGLRAVGVLLDQLTASHEAPLQLPQPSDPRARRVAESLYARPTDLDGALQQAGASRRTLERLFQRETGMSLGAWRRRAVMLAALRALASGGSVTDAALDAGYASPSAFITAFRRLFGATPARYFAEGPDRARTG